MVEVARGVGACRRKSPGSVDLKNPPTSLRVACDQHTRRRQSGVLRGVVTASKSRRRRGGKIFIYRRVMQENVGDTSRKSSTVKLCRQGSAGKRRQPSPKWKEEVKFSFEFGGSSGRDTGLVLQARPLPDDLSCGGEMALFGAVPEPQAAG